MKAGLSLDGKITFRPRQGGSITGPESQRFVHTLRNEVDAILIGAETAVIDNPRLTTRLGDCASVTRDPLRIVLDTTLRMPADQRILTQNSPAETWIFCSENAPEDRAKELESQGVRICRIPTVSNGRLDVSAVLAYLGRKNIISVLVEGGSRIHGSFYSQQLVDELILLYAPYIIGDTGVPLVGGYSVGCREEAQVLTDIRVDRLGDDILVRALINNHPAL
ncbi:MAG: RibD family protein [Desulfobulbus sp.]|nr:RibD family protein [Desulfobulbus sp.]